MKFFYGRNLIVAVTGSIGILLVNIIFGPAVWSMNGVEVTVQQVVNVSVFFFIARIVWFYVMLIWVFLWTNLKARQ